MNVALPEVDGRVLSRAISFKGEAFFDEATECPIATYRAQGDRVEFVAQLAANWAKLGITPEPKRKVALVLANYPNKDGRLANGVGLDTPAGTVHALRLLHDAGYASRMPPGQRPVDACRDVRPHQLAHRPGTENRRRHLAAGHLS